MKVRDILKGKSEEVHTIAADATLHAAIRVLNARRIGALVVVDPEGSIAGIVSERDILREVGKRCDLAAGSESLEAIGPVLVREIMTEDVITATMDDDLTVVMNVMTQNRIRHLPIVEYGALAGIISIGDAVKTCVEVAESEAQTLKEYIQGSVY